MTEIEFLSKFGAILQKAEPLAEDAVLANMPEWDSLAQISMVALFKNELKKPIPFNVVREARTPADLIAFWEN